MLPLGHPIFGAAALPELEVRQDMMLMSQDGPEWQGWRIGKPVNPKHPTTPTMGASFLGTAVGVNKYKTTREGMTMLLTPELRSQRGTILYTETGHVCEPLDDHLTRWAIKGVFGVSKCEGQSLGVMFNINKPYMTASPDKNLLGDTFEVDGHLINLNECLAEYKCPGKTRYTYPSDDHICQAFGQMDASRSQRPEEGPLEAMLSKKNKVILSILEIPFIQSSMVAEIGRERWEVAANKPWTLKAWVIPWHQPTMDWINRRLDLLKEYYMAPNFAAAIPPYFVDERWGGEIPKDYLPPITKLFSRQFWHRGPKAVNLHDKQSKQDFVSQSSFAISPGGRYHPVSPSE